MSRLVPPRYVSSRLEIKAFELPFRHMYSISVLFDHFQTKNLAKIYITFVESHIVPSRVVSIRWCPFDRCLFDRCPFTGVHLTGVHSLVSI